MDNAWIAEIGPDPQQRAREIGNAHASFLSTHALAAVGPGLRDVVARSWMRSSDAHVGQTADPPVMITGDDLSVYRSAHPLSKVIGVLRQLVGTAADDGDYLMAVSDAAGQLLWVEGHRVARARAEQFRRGRARRHRSTIRPPGRCWASSTSPAATGSPTR
jgi:hypothetical protein